MSVLDSIYPNGIPTNKSYSNANISDQEFYALLTELSNNLRGKYNVGVPPADKTGIEGGGFGQPGAEAAYGAPTEAGTKAFNSAIVPAIKGFAMAAVPPLGGAKMAAQIAALIAKYGGDVISWARGLFGLDNATAAEMADYSADWGGLSDAIAANEASAAADAEAAAVAANMGGQTYGGPGEGSPGQADPGGGYGMGGAMFGGGYM
jgi:hypothetical protein